jgi:dGTPase
VGASTQCGITAAVDLAHETVLDEHQELKRFLRTKLYNHPKVREVMDEARGTLKELFEAYLRDPTLLPPEHQAVVSRADAEGGVPARARVWRITWRG